MIKVRIALIGCGRVANHYKYILSQIDNDLFKICAVVDTDINKASAFGKHLGCDYFTSFDDLIVEHKIDLSIILTPSGMHYHHAKFFLMRNVNVLVEKPLAMLPEHCNELSSLANENGLLLCVAFQNRFNKALGHLKKTRDSGQLGKIISASIRLRWCRLQSYYEDGWHGTWLMDGGVINQQAIHHVDALNWILGPVYSISAISTNRLNSLEAEDTMVCIGKFESGALFTVEATTSARPIDYEASLSIVAENGVVEVGGVALNEIKRWDIINQSKVSLANVKALYNETFDSGYGLGHIELLTQTFDAILEKKVVSPVEMESAKFTTSIIHSIYASVEAGSIINLKDKKVSKYLGRQKNER